MVTRSKAPAKARAKPPAKPRAKAATANKRVPAKRKTVTQKVTAKSADRDTLAKLRAHVDDIEKRLKRANTLTRTSVRALKTSYEVLDGDNQTSALTGHIEELSDRLTGMIEKTRLDVAHDLKIVLADPRLETLSGALTKANQRLTAAEQHQAEAINAINVHIARLATAVDERMQREERQREKGDALLSERMDVIEQDSAEAIKLIGDKVVSVSEDLTEKTQALRGELAEQALTRQQDYEEHKHDIARRIEAIEDEQRSQLPAFERGIASLALRLETIENMGAKAFAVSAEPEQFTPAYETAPQVPAQDPSQDNVATAYADAQPDDAFAALELVDMQEVGAPATTASSPYGDVANFGNEIYQQAPPVQQVTAIQMAPEQGYDQDGMQANMQAGQTFETYAPVEYTATVAAMGGQKSEVFSPRAYAPGSQADSATTIQAELPPPVLVADNGLEVYNPTVPVAAMAPPMPTEQVTYNQAPPPMAADLPPMPQETTTNDFQAPEQTMENARPGAEPGAKLGKGKKRKQKKSRKQKDTSGSGSAGHGMIRKVALFGGVAVVALLGYKVMAPKIFGSNSAVPQSVQTNPMVKPLGGTQANSDQIAGAQINRGPDGVINDYQTTDGRTFESVAPVGDYSNSMAAPNLGDDTGADNPQKRTLEAAAADGNPIAQFQLGLSHLEAGRDADAVRLIRLAANQGQPAAQYRLAKLYEAGIGVKVNGKTAKDLLSRSAKAGNRIAMHDLGHYFATGADGSAPDLQQAVKWFSMAAERGVLDSQFNLAVLYQNGNGVPRSLEDAYVWYAIAGAQGDKIAVQRSDALARDLSPELLKAAQARVKAYAPKPVDNVANGVFKNLPWISAKAAKASTNPRQVSATSVKSAQKMLSSLGYQVGTPDGAMGPNTRNAIISFERANGMPQTGRVNAALIERLQLAVGA